ncbi:hypothetical protein BN14_08497 [Rhizoctonia solani AG-1 IB]|uniref:Retrotransposon gag domain-containing protein n=1 Tax=Thanatephorus cucumeris (strain AG1-IB / isolate 7/3/14) TaxID=1108050 RepID=M5C4Y9_THACB|nr:hypothetical protein BN14_08497 [Rhizoctonia solani AG-1 IB]
MNLKEGRPKKWGQIYLEKLLDGAHEPILESWDAFEAAFLRNSSNPAAAQVAERRLRNLKQSRAASNYATDFRIIASKLEWSDAALIAAFRQGHKAEVRSKLIKFTLHKNITTLDEFISTACLIDDTLFEARQELRKIPTPLHQPHVLHKEDLAILSQEACRNSAARLGNALSAEISRINGKNARMDGA